MADVVRINVEQGDAAAFLAAMAARGRDLQPAMQSVAGILAAAAENAFQMEGPGWPELAPATIRQRRSRGYWPGKILQRRGRLAQSVQQGHSETAAWAGTNMKYARIHQLGGTVRIPGRTVQLVLRRPARGKRKGRTLFGGNRHANQKNVEKRSVTIPAYDVTIPARPYLRLGKDGLARIKAALEKHLLGA